MIRGDQRILFASAKHIKKYVCGHSQPLTLVVILWMSGPFNTTHYNVDMPGRGKIGDFNLLVDDDGSAYHVRTGFDIVKLNANFTGPDVLMSSFSLGGEGPVFFKRNGTYYILSGSGCCACIGGSSIIVNMADSLTGPWTQQGDVGSNPTKFDPHSPNNYVTKAQASTVFSVSTSSGDTIFVRGRTKCALGRGGIGRGARRVGVGQGGAV
eukprot:m.544418 g.544418  ORF g.544418 m.544418 type:complete len:210 (+) comp22138_c0_seq25:42-671(+)